MAKNFKFLQEKMSLEARERSETKANQMIREMALDELRAALNLTQEHLAAKLHVKQSAISRMERRADMFVSTLRQFIEAMGGDLEIRAVLPRGEVILINQFSKLRKPRRRHSTAHAVAAF